MIRRAPHHNTPRTHELTDREREVLRLVATGARNKEIGRALGITERTVESHVANACEWLGVNNRLAAVVRAGILRSGHAE